LPNSIIHDADVICQIVGEVHNLPHASGRLELPIATSCPSGRTAKTASATKRTARELERLALHLLPLFLLLIR